MALLEMRDYNAIIAVNAFTIGGHTHGQHDHSQFG